jgi:hypothetical protein
MWESQIIRILRSRFRVPACMDMEESIDQCQRHISLQKIVENLILGLKI